MLASDKHNAFGIRMFVQIFPSRSNKVVNRLSNLTLFHFFWVIVIAPSFAIAQMGGGGMGGGSPQTGLPMFNEEKFRDKVYEAGGPQFVDNKNGKLILSVTIEGNRSVSEHKILSHMQCRVDRLFDKDAFNRDIGELYRTGLFDRIEPFTEPSAPGETPEGIHIRLLVREKLTVISVDFHGNRALDDKQLQKHCGLDVGDPTNASAVNSARNRLVEYYQDQGFNSADVRVVSGNKPGERRIVFEISEGSWNGFKKSTLLATSPFNRTY